MREKSRPKKEKYLFSVLAVLFFSVLAVNAMATEEVRKEAQATIAASLDALWSGQSFSPQLKQKQQALRKMIANRVVTGTGLEGMIAEATLAVFDREKTTRHDFKKMPERVEELLSPYMEWEEFRNILWKQGVSRIKEGRQMVISVGTLAPAGTPWLVVPERLASEIMEISSNKVNIRIYPGGVMGEDTDILRKMDVGQLDGGGLTAIGILNASPETCVFLLPGLFNDYDEIDYIFKRFRKRIDQAFEERGYILASLIDTGNLYIFSKNRITGLADIRRSKMMTTFGIVETTMFNELGISAMPVAITEVVTALSTGMADTVAGPAAWMLGMQAYSYMNYFVKEPLFYSPAAVLVSTGIRDKYQKQLGLSEICVHNLQELLVFEFSSLEDEWKRRARSYEERCLEAFITKVGMKAVTLPPEDRKRIERAGQNVWTKLADRAYPKNLLDDILNALEEYRQNRQ